MAIEPELPAPDVTMAAELALGVLEGEERATALRRALAEPEFALEVAGWRDRLAPMLDAVPGETPPDALWPRIEQALGAATNGAVVKRLQRWRSLALVSTGLAASLGAFLVARPPESAPAPQIVQQPAQPVLVAQLAPENAPPVLLAAWHEDSGVVRIAPAALATQGLSPELWLIPADGTPRSLGLFDPARPIDVTVPQQHRALVASEITLAVSLEPAGGSPTGLPTGPVVASGKLTPI